MTLSKAERQTLLGPAVVGAVFGLLAGFADFGVALEYGRNMRPMYFGVHWPLLEALITFSLVSSGIAFLFGVMPLVVARVIAKRARR
jgi:hypothetical protein